MTEGVRVTQSSKPNNPTELASSVQIFLAPTQENKRTATGTKGQLDGQSRIGQFLHLPLSL
jgi:hypothetical protein